LIYISKSIEFLEDVKFSSAISELIYNKRLKKKSNNNISYLNDVFTYISHSQMNSPSMKRRIASGSITDKRNKNLTLISIIVWREKYYKLYQKKQPIDEITVC